MERNMVGNMERNLEKRELLYEGKAKKIYHTSVADLLWVEYKDDATAFNGDKKGMIPNKGMLNNRISALFFTRLQQTGIPVHFIKTIAEREQWVRKVNIVPIEVVVRNIVTGSLARRFGLNEGIELKRPVIELYYKNDDLQDPLMNEDHVYMLELASARELQQMKDLALRVNETLTEWLVAVGLMLVDFKLEFGRSTEGEILVADEISPDTCRFWDVQTKEKLDKDRFRQGIGGEEQAYQEIYNRLGGEGNGSR